MPTDYTAPREDTLLLSMDCASCGKRVTHAFSPPRERYVGEMVCASCGKVTIFDVERKHRDGKA